MNDNTKVDMKQCSKCKETKTRTSDFFYRSKKSKDGFQSFCKTCASEYGKKHYQNNKEYHTSKNKKWAKENRERMLELQRNWYRENYPKNKDAENKRSKKFFANNPNYRKKYYQKHKRRHNELTKEWHEKNKEKHRNLKRKWYEENKELFRVYCVRYQHKKRELPYDFTNSDWKQALDFFGYSCAYCGEFSETFHKEHIIPVSKGGGFVRSNIIPSCASCNLSKHNNDFEDWYKNKDFYSVERELKIKKYIEINKKHLKEAD